MTNDYSIYYLKRSVFHQIAYRERKSIFTFLTKIIEYTTFIQLSRNMQIISIFNQICKKYVDHKIHTLRN